jgi:hypothetical protein
VCSRSLCDLAGAWMHDEGAIWVGGALVDSAPGAAGEIIVHRARRRRYPNDAPGVDIAASKLSSTRASR